MKHRFRSVIEQARGPGATVVLIPADVATALGGLKQQRVIGSVNDGEPFATSTYPWKGVGLYVGVPKASREAAGVVLGDEVELELELELRPRVIELPPELEAAFAAEPELRSRFEALSWSRKRLIFEPVADAKKPETRAARLQKAVAELRALG
jgi:antitoxin component of MazEF toxin-antitoxin module